MSHRYPTKYERSRRTIQQLKDIEKRNKMVTDNRYNTQPSNSAEMFDISATLLKESADGIKVRDGAKVFWLPKSQVEHDLEVGETGIISIPEWLAIKKELV